MSETISRVSLGVQIDVDTRGKGFNLLFDELKESGIEPVEPSDAHITVLRADHCNFWPIDQHELDVMRNTMTMIGGILVDQQVDLEVFWPDNDRGLKSFGKKREKVGMYMAGMDFYRDLHGSIAEIIDDQLGIEVPPFADDAHLIVGTKTNSFFATPPADNPYRRKRGRLRLPQDIHTRGYTVLSEETDFVLTREARRVRRRGDAGRFLNQPISRRRNIA